MLGLLHGNEGDLQRQTADAEHNDALDFVYMPSFAFNENAVTVSSTDMYSVHSGY